MVQTNLQELLSGQTKNQTLSSNISALVSVMLLWLNGSKSLPGSKVLWESFPK